MNEYKIAKAQQAYSPPTLEEIIKQQADRIAELEKHNEALADEYAIQVNEVCRLSYEIEKLEKQVKSVIEQGENFWQQLCELKAQTKPLTDEEIDKLAKKFGVVGLHEDAGLYEFVRKILNNG